MGWEVDQGADPVKVGVVSSRQIIMIVTKPIISKNEYCSIVHNNNYNVCQGPSVSLVSVLIS